VAAIDKIYGTNKQYDEFYEWCKINHTDALKYFYPRDDYTEVFGRPITNFTEKMDKWMVKNCNIKWVTNYIKNQYGGKM